MNTDNESSVNLLEGNILKSLTAFSLPIMATSFVQTVYSLTDMAWIGRSGSNAVAAIGAAAMFNWLGNALVLLARTGGQVKVSHSYGEKDPTAVEEYGRGALQITLVLALLFGSTVNLIPHLLIGFFRLESQEVVSNAITYLRICCGLCIFLFTSTTLTGLYNGAGDSRTPFISSFFGLVTNMVLDPILIFGLGPFPTLGVTGAGIATVIGQFVVCVLLLINMRGKPLLQSQLTIWKRTPAWRIKSILRLGFPSALQNMLYSMISMTLARFVSAWGDSAIAIQRLDGQIESISWMTADGFGAAINAFIGQNYGAGSQDRVRKGYTISCSVVALWGLAVSVLFVVFAEPLFWVFIKEPEILAGGAAYLRILGYGEVFVCIEMMTVGAMAGLGRTLESSVISISLTSIRIPMAYLLSHYTPLGLNGIWWTFTITSIIKGCVFLIAFRFYSSPKRIFRNKT